MRIALLVGMIALFTCGSAAAQKELDSSRMVTVLSFNILHGATTKGDFNLDVIADVIKRTNPDFVALQEVDFLTNRAKKYDLVTELGWRTSMAPIFGRAMHYDGGEYGEGVLSKYSFISSRNVVLPSSEGKEPRAALEIVTVIPSGDTISFIGTHLDHTENEMDRINQATAINRTFANSKYPAILAGDLNATPESKTIKIFTSQWTASDDLEKPLLTYPSSKPDKKIDYVMYSPKKQWTVLKKEAVCDEIASDHCSYLVTLILN